MRADVLILALVASCGAQTPTPPIGPHTSLDRPVEVRSAPESVRVEELPPQPSPESVWVDGQWRWVGRRWQWQPGQWTIAPPGAYLARPVLVRLPVAVYAEADAGTTQTLIGYGMRLMYIEGHWHLADGGIAEIGEAASRDQ